MFIMVLFVELFGLMPAAAAQALAQEP